MGLFVGFRQCMRDETLTHTVFLSQPLQRSIERGLTGGHVVLFGDRAGGVAEEELVEAA